MKRLLAAILCALVTASAVAATQVSAEPGIDLPSVDFPSDDSGDEIGDLFPDVPDYPYNTVTSGDWVYTVEDGNAMIVEYTGSDEQLTIPAAIDNIPVTKIEEGAFSGSETLKNVTVPEGITSIGDGAFAMSEALESITLPDSLTSIGAYAFSGTAYWAAESNWKDGALYIGKYLVEIEENHTGDFAVTEGTVLLADGVFDMQDAIEKISLPTSLASIGTNYFIGCYSLEAFEVDSANRHYATLDKVLYNKELTTLVRVPCNIWETYYDLPKTLTSIMPYAFSACGGYCGLVIPEGVTEIPEGAFSEYKILETVMLPSTLTKIGDGAFSMCTALSELIIPENVTTIGDAAFTLCHSLPEITLPAKVAEVGEAAFMGCAKLEKINVAEENAAFTEIDGLLCSKDGTVLVACPGSKTQLSIPKGVTTIGVGAVAGCTELEKVTFSDSVTTIGEGAFTTCVKLPSINIPSSVTKIDAGAFALCASLARITLPAGPVEIGEGVFAVCTALKSIRIPEGITKIGDGMFYGCSELRSVTIPKSVTTIGEAAFNSACVETIYYKGSEEEWKNVSVGEANEDMGLIKMVYNSDGPIIIPGDANGDGNINARDISTIMKYLVGSEPDVFIQEAADFNNDGKINARDITAIMKSLLA